MFNFFLECYRKEILTFCGSSVEVKFDKTSEDGKFSFRLFEDGKFKNKQISSIHPNILKAVIIGKKSWGLWMIEWANGIAEGSFTKYEILKEFEDRNIIIPESLKIDFENTIIKKVLQRSKP
jgi:hypothetical protein